MSTASREGVKVVLIDTQFVKTDPKSFKSVVQRLTGKDSCVAWIEESSFKSQERGMQIASDGALGRLSGCAAAAADGGVPVLSEGLSCKDYDKLMMEISPLHGFNWFSAD